MLCVNIPRADQSPTADDEVLQLFIQKCAQEQKHKLYNQLTVGNSARRHQQISPNRFYQHSAVYKVTSSLPFKWMDLYQLIDTVRIKESLRVVCQILVCSLIVTDSSMPTVYYFCSRHGSAGSFLLRQGSEHSLGEGDRVGLPLDPRKTPVFLGSVLWANLGVLGQALSLQTGMSPPEGDGLDLWSSMASTWAIRWCCSLITRDTAICMLPNTATTSRILSSNDGAAKVWKSQHESCLSHFPKHPAPCFASCSGGSDEADRPTPSGKCNTRGSICYPGSTLPRTSSHTCYLLAMRPQTSYSCPSSFRAK